MSTHDIADGHKSTECEALLDACTPLVYRHNAFRISGLPVDATTRDVKRRIDDLKHAEELGDAEDEHTHAFALQPPPTVEHIREAAQRLHDPERRIIEEFFWFWPSGWGEGKHDPALAALSQGKKDDAFQIWRELLSNDHSVPTVIAKHNLAVMYQLVALDSEYVSLETDLSQDQLATIAKYWRTCFKWWEELTDDEIFWSLVTDRIRILDDPRLTTGFARRLRTTLPAAMDKINAMLAMSFAEAGKLTLATNHITYMKETHQGQDDIPKTLATITKPLKTRVRNAIETATAAAQRNAESAGAAAKELLAAVAEPIRVIQMILPPEDHERIDICDSIAEACLTCQIAYARETEDWTLSLDILDRAAPYAVSADTKSRLAENRATVANNGIYDQYLEPITEKMKELDSNPSVAARMRVVEAEILPHLRTIERLPGMSAEAYAICANMVASYIRGLSVSIYNEDSDLPSAIRILDVAIATARGAEAKAQLQKDKIQLAEMKAERTKNNLHMQIRSDDIEVTNEFVRYNTHQIPIGQIQGIKFGVFVQYTNGVKSSSSYLIDISGGQTGSISIECKRFFRSDTQAETDFHQIIQALAHQVFPSLVQRLAEGIVAGRPLPMGDCRLTVDGMYITTGSLWWKKETLVPYSDLRYGTSQGYLSVSSAADKHISASMGLRGTWNAVIFEYVAKTVVELKPKRRSAPPPIPRNRQ